MAGDGLNNYSWNERNQLATVKDANPGMFLVREGTLEVTINGKSSKAGPGSVAFISSNDVHGIRNVGSNHARYFVLAIHRPGDKES